MIALPETDFHKRGSLIFLVVNGRYYNAGNFEPTERNYLNLCGMTFPLSQGREISDEEKSYMRKHENKIKELQEDIEKDIRSGNILSSLRAELSLLQDTHFFLTEICPRYDPEVKIKQYVKEQNAFIPKFDPFRTNQTFLPEILQGNCLVINGRVYPMKRSNQPEFVDLNGVSYTIDRSTRTIDDVEKTFHNKLTEAVKSFTIAESETAHRIEQDTVELKEKIELLKEDLHVSQYNHCYELGDIGFDTSIKSVYWLIPPHYNHTSGANYGEGQSAVSLSLTNGNLATAARFVERNDSNSAFNFHSHGNCYGFSFSGSSLEDKMHYLHTCSVVVFNNQRFYQAETSSSDSNDGYSSY